jgi:riboflavin kinase/FMN adenylyltransferase
MFYGTVVHGDGVAKMFGFPTANLALSDKDMSMSDGVYAAISTLDGTSFDSALIISRGGTKVEIHLLDKNIDLYGEIMSVESLAFISPIVRCDTSKQLQSAVLFAIEKVRSFFVCKR